MWKLEQIPNSIVLLKDHNLVEMHSKETFRILDDGCFQIYLPLQSDLTPIRGSRDIAIHRFSSVEPFHITYIRQDYNAFMEAF